MNNIEAYNKWSETYDSVINRTRDIEAYALRSVLPHIHFANVLEIGCGTGKNTEWLASKANQVTAIDFSSEMINKAKEKIKKDNVHFIKADITQQWNFTAEKFDLITFSLILEHIENINFVFEQMNAALKPGGYIYIGELHPFKQYTGSKARFDNGNGTFELDCYTHNISDYFNAGINNGFECVKIDEWFDENDKSSIPRVLSILFKKKNN